MIRPMRKNKYLFLLCAILIVSCNESAVYREKKEIPKEVWQIKEPINFRFVAEDTLQDYNIFLTFDLKKNFKTSNLWIFARTQSPEGYTQQDTLMFHITDYAGNWYGNKKGSLISHKFPYKTNIRFPQKGAYTFTLSHGMRPNQLPEIKNVGLVIEKIKTLKNS
ncbi:MAG: hypothetical protein CSB06_00270 [Bacteroidia bacterium]|nr:MAG: hypothetical protein CSB06_00270 [Bacteroidia bacterium]